MKKIIITLSIIFAIFISFGFIVMQHPKNDTVELEQVSNNKVDSELAVMEETNDEQW